MAYRFDSDLEFLGKLNSAELNDLVYTLTHDKDGSSRFTEELTTAASYKNHHPNHIKYWELIAAEIQCFGANSLATIFRQGKGVPYREVLIDVCDKLKVNYNEKSSIETIEKNLLQKIFEDAVAAMTPEQVTELANTLGSTNSSLLSKEALLASFQAAFRLGGFKSYQLTAIIVNQVLKALIGRGLSIAATGTVMRSLSVFAGPVGWALTGAWTAVDIASAAYRVTIPAVLQVAVLRQKHLYGQDDK